MSEQPYKVALIRISSDRAPEIAISADGHRWYTAGPRLGSQYGWYADHIEIIRPLVVLDLSDEPVEGDVPGRNEPQLLISMLRETAENFFTPDAAELARKVADQIEQQTRPQKPAEPGRYGVVVAGDGREWFRWTTSERDGFDWCRPAIGDGDATRYARWADLDVIRVEREGVQP